MIAQQSERRHRHGHASGRSAHGAPGLPRGTRHSGRGNGGSSTTGRRGDGQSGYDADGQSGYDAGDPAYVGQKGRRWAMRIDLRWCIGCQACTVACKLEHNVPEGHCRTWVPSSARSRMSAGPSCRDSVSTASGPPAPRSAPPVPPGHATTVWSRSTTRSAGAVGPTSMPARTMPASSLRSPAPPTHAPSAPSVSIRVCCPPVWRAASAAPDSSVT